MINKIYVGIYVRVSTEEQKEYGYSIPQQIDLLTKLADKNNWSIYKIYNDAGISGKNTEDRPMLKALLNDVKNNQISKVLITKLDRLSRNVIDTATLLNIFNNFNCELIDYSGRKIESDNPSDWLFTIIQSAFGQYERKAIISRIKDGFAGKVKMGKSICSSTPPYGYNREKGCSVLSINEEEAAVVKQIYNMYLDGYSLTNIARFLNASKIATKRSGQVINGKKVIARWTPKTVKLILTNSTYIGKVRYHLNQKDYYECDGEHLPLIDLKIYNQVQEKHIKARNTSKTNKPTEDVYFCGTLVCSKCHTKLTTQRTIKYNKNKEPKVFYGYRCRNRELGLCDGIGMSHKKVEEAFLKYLDKIERMMKFNHFDISMTDNNKEIEVKELKRVINKVKDKKKEIMQLFMEDTITNKQMQYMIKEIDIKNRILREQLTKLERRLILDNNIISDNLTTNFKEHWCWLTNKEKLEFLNQFIEYIIIKNENNNKKGNSVSILSVKLYD
ncbi:MAG: recombinase family protein [Bacilli bacterium]|nr:recombinase family protein [Bacilli bacterium]